MRQITNRNKYEDRHPSVRFVSTTKLQGSCGVIGLLENYGYMNRQSYFCWTKNNVLFIITLSIYIIYMLPWSLYEEKKQNKQTETIIVVWRTELRHVN